MSQSIARRRRLAVARTFPQAHCPECGASLRLIFNVDRHLARCAELAKSTRSGAS